MKSFKKLFVIAITSLALSFVVPYIPFMDAGTTTAEAAKISKKSLVLIKGQSATLKVSGTKKRPKWTSSRRTVATVSSRGKVVAKKKGTTTITAKIGTKKYSCRVTVQTPSISKKNVSLTVGKSATLKLNGTKQKVTWKSSNKKVATVNSKGKIVAKKTGKATITATVLKKKYTCKVTVKAKSPVQIINPKPNNPKPSNPTPEKPNTPSIPSYSEGMYKVGSTIPAGEYVIYASNEWGGYFEVCEDSTGLLSSIIFNDNFDYNSIITVKNGEYLKLERCYAVPASSVKISSSKDGMFRVGIDIPAGEYLLLPTSEFGGYYEVTTDSRHSLASIVSNDNFNGPEYVTVSNGQYLKIVRAQISS